ncbi:MAG TPA: amino acid adenylation domain-containing protein, partial [Longimicrobiaceae bacterium]
AEMGAQGDLSRHPIIQAMVFVHNFVRDTVPLRDEGGEEDPSVLRSVPMYTGMEVGLVDTGTSKFDFGFSLHDIPGSLTGFVEYNTDLFDASTMEALVARYLRVLRQVTADPGTGVWELDLMDAGERRRVREEWNATARPYPPGDTVPSLFAAQAARTPDAVAVAAPGDGSLTYAALAERSGRLADALRGLGVGPEVRVGVCVERGPEMVVALLAVLRAGGAYVPLDPEYPAERLAWMLADSAVPVLLTQAPLVERLPAHGARTVLLDAPLPPGGERGAAAEPAPENLAYVIYTSGSTGRPKGVMVEHRNLANLLLGTRDAFGLREGDVYPALGSFAFDISLMEMFAPLVTGGTVRVVERERILDVERLVEELAGSTVLHVVPAVMRRAAAAVRAGPGTLPGMRRILVGGDVVAPDLVPEIRAAFPGAEVRIMYGPTETTVLATGHLVDAEETVDRALMGAPLPNVRAYVCGGDGELVPPGVPGELWLGGRGVARGYLGRPELTAEKFVPDPFSGEPGARLYRTGDRARWLAEGTMEFLGRVDAQVKVRGFRIEPGEVEAALAAHPAVRESVVAALGDPGDAWLAGYVVPAEGMAPDPAELRAWLAGRLPEHMVPGAVVVMDAFPLNGSGKVDRRALPAPEAAGREEYVAPRTPAEETVASVWAEVLEVERVGARDSFFTLGGHSLLATQVISRLRALLGVEVPLRVVFEEATVERLAARVDELLAEGPAAGPAPITRRAREVRKPGAPAPG